MILTTRAMGLLLAIALATGGAAWGVHTFLSPASASGSDYGLDTDGNGKFEWLVVEADVNLPKAGTWDINADLSTPVPPPSDACGFYGKPLPVPMVRASGGYGPIAWVSERYFFPAGGQTVRMAFAGADIARAGVDGPYAVHAFLSLGGFPYPGLERPEPIPPPGDVLEWNYTTQAYSAGAFDPPFRAAYFPGPHSDRAMDVDGDGLADVLQLTADVHVNKAGNYSLYGTLLEGNATDVIRMIAYGSRTIRLEAGDTTASLGFRGDQIRAAGVDGPWRFVLTIFPNEVPYLGGALPPADGLGRPGVVPYPEMLCGTTGTYRAADFDDTAELLRYTGRFEEATPDVDGDGLHDALVIRAEVDVFASAGFDVAGTLRPKGGSTVLAQVGGQAWLSDGVQWAEFAFPGPEIRASGVDGPYEATLSLKPIDGRLDPAITYVTGAYKASDFDDAPVGPRPYWVRDLNATAAKGDLVISVDVVRGNDVPQVVYEDVLLVTVSDSAGTTVGEFKDRVSLPAPGSAQAFSFTVPGIPPGTYTITAVLGSPDRPVDTRIITLTI
jgi:hypothetical protein